MPTMNISLILCLLTALGCAATPRKVVSEGTPPPTSAVDDQVGAAVSNSAAKEAGSDYFVEVTMDKGSKKINPSAQTSVQALLTRAAQRGTVENIKILSWADQEYPSDKKAKLAPAQRKLATERNTSFSNYLRRLTPKASIETYNLAETPNIFSKWFNTQDARLKNTLVAAGLPTTADDPQYPSKASHVIVMVQVSDKK